MLPNMKTKWKLTILLAAMAGLLVSGQAHAANYTIINISNNAAGPDESPQINASGQVVWRGRDGSDFEIFFYDGSTVTQLTDNAYDDWNPQINDSSQVVWGEYDGTDFEIFFYDGLTVTQLTDNAYIDWNPQINDSGQVVWEGWDGSDGEIFFYNGSTVTQLTDHAYDDRYPQINDIGQVVWDGWDGTDWEIFFYNGSTVTQLTDHAYDDRHPQINASGQVVWFGYDGTDRELFFYDGSTVTQLTDNAFLDQYTHINASGQVVWFGYDGTDNEIFFYDGSTVTQLTDNAYLDWYPQINDSGQVVWEGWNGTDFEIFLATPAAGDTPIGSPVVVAPEDTTTGGTPVTITFNEVTGAGETTLTISGNGTPPPAGFKLGNPPTYYEISTTASFIPPVMICIDYSGIAYGDESALKLKHHEDTNGDGIGDKWVDATCTSGVDGCPDPNPDTVNHVICGIVNSFSEFAIFEPDSPLICVEPPSGLVGWWPGDGHADDIWSDNHGTLMNGATFASGKVGQAFSLDGVDDYVQIPYDASFNLSNFTLQAWVKFTQNDTFARIISRSSGGNPTDGFSFFTLSNAFGKIGGGVQGEGAAYTVSVSTAPTTFNDGGWHLCTFVRDVDAGENGEIRIHVDAYAPWSYADSSPGNMEHNYNGIMIGSVDGSTSFFEGLIDEVAIWNRALSADEILAIFNAGGKCKQPDIDVSPLDYQFGEVELGTFSTVIVTVSNVGSAPLTVDSIDFETGSILAFETGSSGDFAITSAPELPAVVAPGGSLGDVEITYTPSAAGLSSAVLNIGSDDPDEPSVVVSLSGTGVEVEPPPSEQIQVILDFFDASVDGETLMGDGPGNSAEKRLNALRNMIETAGDLIEDGLLDDACEQLQAAYKKTDGVPKPPDFVTGEAASVLANLIQDLMTNIGCG